MPNGRETLAPLSGGALLRLPQFDGFFQQGDRKTNHQGVPAQEQGYFSHFSSPVTPSQPQKRGSRLYRVVLPAGLNCQFLQTLQRKRLASSSAVE